MVTLSSGRLVAAGIVLRGVLVSFALVNARLANGDLVDLQIDGGQIASVGAGAGGSASERIDAQGGLVLPGFIDTHIHLDKALTRAKLRDHDGTLAGAIETMQDLKRHYTVDDVRLRAREVIRNSAMTGTTRLRSHVDVDTIGGLVPLQGVMAAARECSYFAEVTTIAFPQEGIIRDPGTAELMTQAMEQGADIVGGMPHWERNEHDQREHVRFCFELARRFNADVDMHVDETDDGSVRTLAMVVDETINAGWQGESPSATCARWQRPTTTMPSWSSQDVSRRRSRSCPTQALISCCKDAAIMG